MKKTIKPSTKKEYEESKISIALGLCPTIYPCKKCGWPVVSGYCCNYCNDTNPNESEEQ